MALFKKKRGDDRRLIGDRRWCSDRRMSIEEEEREDGSFEPPRTGERRGKQRRSGEDRRKSD